MSDLELTMMRRVGELNKENARLKAEVERLKEGNECLDQMHEKEMARSAFLCEEVNRTTAWGRGLESDLSWARAELLMVKAQVERLTKAGDGLYKSMLEIGCNEMADNFQYDAWWGSMTDWNAAKEGKGQP
jgi:uncharacterized small protein (DUF1192 family)